MADVVALIDRCCDEVLDLEYRTASWRLLSDVVAADPEIFDRGHVNTAAAAIVWIVGKVNDLFSEGGLTVSVGDLVQQFGMSGSPAQRARTMLGALGIDAPAGADIVLGTPRYLVSERRKGIARRRDHLTLILQGD